MDNRLCERKLFDAFIVFRSLKFPLTLLLKVWTLGLKILLKKKLKKKEIKKTIWKILKIDYTTKTWYMIKNYIQYKNFRNSWCVNSVSY